MAFKIIIITFLLPALIACSDLGANDRDRSYTRQPSPNTAILSSSVCIELREEEENEKDGAPSLENVETTSFYGWLQNCRTGFSTPDNTIDVVVSAIGLQDKYTPGRLRECLRCKLAEAHNKICSTRDELERQRQDANSDADRNRIENSIARLDELQFNFNERLYKESNKLNDKANSYADKDSSSVGGRIWNWVGQEEAEALRDILNAESYNECNSFHYDDADDYRYEDDSRRNDSYARRRSY